MTGSLPARSDELDAAQARAARSTRRIPQVPTLHVPYRLRRAVVVGLLVALPAAAIASATYTVTGVPWEAEEQPASSQQQPSFPMQGGAGGMFGEAGETAAVGAIGALTATTTWSIGAGGAATGSSSPSSGSGTVTAIVVREGQRVKRGQVLARLDRRSAVRELASARLQLDAAREAVDNPEQAVRTTRGGGYGGGASVRVTPSGRNVAADDALDEDDDTAGEEPDTCEGAGGGGAGGVVDGGAGNGDDGGGTPPGGAQHPRAEPQPGAGGDVCDADENEGAGGDVQPGGQPGGSGGGASGGGAGGGIPGGGGGGISMPGGGGMAGPGGAGPGATAVPSVTVTQSAEAIEQRAAAGLATARARVLAAKRALAATVLRAPADGVIVSIDATTGARVGSEGFITLRGALAWIEVDVAETDVISIEVGDTAAITVDSLDAQVAGTVRTIGEPDAIDVTSAVVTFPVGITLSAPLAGARDGMTADVSISPGSSA